MTKQLLLTVLIGLTTIQAWAAPPDANQLYKDASAALRSQKYGQALTGFLELTREHPQSGLVTGGHADYMVVLCYQLNKQPAKVLETGAAYLTRFPNKPLTPYVYILLSRAHAALGQTAQSRATLKRLVAEHPKSKAAETARNQLSGKTGAAGAAKRDFFADEDQPYSYPRRALLDSPVEVLTRPTRRKDVYLVLTNLTPKDPYYRVVDRIVEHRDPRAVVTFRGDAFYSRQMRAKLRELQPDYVVFVTRPETLDPNFAYDAFEMAAMVDSDPFTDYLYGFITGQTAAEALAFYERIVKAERERTQIPRKILRCSPSNVDRYYPQRPGAGAGPYAESHLYWDSRKQDKSPFMLQHLDKLPGNGVIGLGGHGAPERIAHGYTPEMIRKTDLYPAVVFNGACYTGSTHRVINDGARRGKLNTTRSIKPGQSLCLAFLASGTTGYFAAFSPDRGNVAGYERLYLTSSGEPLGAVMKYSYDLIVMGNHGAWFSFPRFYEGQPNPVAGGHRNHQTLQLIGNGTRVLFGDPQFKPLDRQHDGYVRPRVVRRDGKQVVLRMEVAVASHEAFFNVYHWLKDRLYCTWELPKGIDGIAGVTLGSVVANGKTLKAERPIWQIEQVKGKRLLHLEVDIAKDQSGQVRKVGAYAELTIQLGRPLTTHLEQACAAGDRLLAQISKDAHGARLAGVDAKDERSLYSGPAGAAVFLANLGAATGRTQYGEAAVELMRRLNKISAQPTDKRRPDPGLYTGLAGIGWANLYVYRRTGQRPLLDAASDCARQVSGAAHRSTDVIAGAAGTGMFLIDLYRETKDKALLVELERIARYLEGAAVAEGEGLKWPAHPGSKTKAGKEVIYPGFAHGTAGVGYFFACLYELTGKRPLLQIANRTAAQLAAVAVEDPDERGLKWYHWEPEKTSLFKQQWCHGSPGVGLFLIKLYEVGKDLRHLASARKAAWSTYTSGRYYRTGAGQCHGSAGNGELLLEMARVTGERTYHRWAEDMAEMVRYKARRHGDQLSWDAHDWRSGTESPSFMVGSSGAAHFLLRVALPQKIEMPFMIRSR